MDIYIMGIKVDYKIENERNIKDLVESLLEIVNDYGQVITELRVDGKTFYPDDPNLENVLIENVTNLEVEVASFFEISSSLIASLPIFIETFISHIKNDTINFANFNEAKYWIIDVLSSSFNVIFTIINNSETIRKRDSFIERLSSFSFSDIENNQRKEMLVNLLEEIKAFSINISSLVSKISEKETMFFDTTIDNNISEILRLLDDIPTKLQIGKDTEAMKDIYELSDLLIETLEIINSTIVLSRYNKEVNETLSNYRYKEVLEEIKSIISNIIDAISNNDLILASDLINYELSEKVKYISGLIESIRNIVIKQISEN
ncbi:MAG: hypothetical protein ACP5KI_01300 [Brevinematia bacterium]